MVLKERALARKMVCLPKHKFWNLLSRGCRSTPKRKAFVCLYCHAGALLQTLDDWPVSRECEMEVSAGKGKKCSTARTRCWKKKKQKFRVSSHGRDYLPFLPGLGDADTIAKRSCEGRSNC